MELNIKQLVMRNGKCGVEEALKILYSKWNIEILNACSKSIDFKQLQIDLSFIPRTTLIKNLNKLVNLNLIINNDNEYILSKEANDLLNINKKIENYLSTFESFNSLEEKYNYINKAFGKKWKARVIWLLGTYKIVRFNEFCNCIEGISHKVLKEVLLDLEETNIINRVEYSGKVLKVEYTLTEKGNQFSLFINDLSNWSKRNGLTQKVTINIE